MVITQTLLVRYPISSPFATTQLVDHSHAHVVHTSLLCDLSGKMNPTELADRSRAHVHTLKLLLLDEDLQV